MHTTPFVYRHVRLYPTVDVSDDKIRSTCEPENTQPVQILESSGSGPGGVAEEAAVGGSGGLEREEGEGRQPLEELSDVVRPVQERREVARGHAGPTRGGQCLFGWGGVVGQKGHSKSTIIHIGGKGPNNPKIQIYGL